MKKILTCCGRGCVVGWTCVSHRQQAWLSIPSAFSEQQTRPLCTGRTWTVIRGDFVDDTKDCCHMCILSGLSLPADPHERANVGIWSEHQQSYPGSPSHPRDSQPKPPSPCLDTHKLLQEKPASCLGNRKSL